jgi:glucose/mannose transport system substrate-binding protein
MNKKEVIFITAIFVGVFVGSISPAVKEEQGIEQIEEIIENHDAGGQLRVYNWWTAGGEKQGIDSVFEFFHSLYPNVAIINSPVSGGAGTSMKQIVIVQVIAGNAPESFQCHPGYEAYPYYEAGGLEEVNDIWEYAKIEKRTPKAIQDVCKIKDDYYMTPIGVHRTNVVWYNKDIFDMYDIELPSKPMTFEDFWSTCDELKEKLPEGKYPLALGDRNNWPATHIFEQIMLGISPQTYEDFINGKVKVSQLEPVLKEFKKYLSYAPPDHRARTWDEACGMIFSGECAMYIHGDWAKGYFTARGWEYGDQYGTFLSPGTSDWFGLCSDAFAMPKNSVDPDNAIRWMYSYTAVEAQKKFNPLKGSVSPFTDVPLEIYDKYSEKCAKDLYNPEIKIFPSIAHGHGSPHEVLADLNPLIGKFASDPRDIRGTAKKIVEILQDIEHPKSWDIV